MGMAVPPSRPASPYNQLYIYYLEGRLASPFESFGDAFIGNWEEGDTSFLFFSEPADESIHRLVENQPRLSLSERFCMTYDEWHGEPVEPFRAGRFFIMPPWKKESLRETDIPIILDPGVVFGAGSHPTTRDCLNAIETLFKDEKVSSTLDLGTGTGLLAIAAARLGSTHNIAVDNNFLAARTARKNAVLNNLVDHVNIVCGSAEDFLGPAADLLIANIHYDVMKDLIELPGFLNKKWFILSGLLRTEAGLIESRLSKLPVTLMEKWVRDGVWHTLFGRVNSI